MASPLATVTARRASALRTWSERADVLHWRRSLPAEIRSHARTYSPLARHGDAGHARRRGQTRDRSAHQRNRGRNDRPDAPRLRPRSPAAAALPRRFGGAVAHARVGPAAAYDLGGPADPRRSRRPDHGAALPLARVG